MNESDVAYKILNRRNQLSAVVMMGEMQQELGADGYALALERRWIEPNYDSGQLSIADRPTPLAEMRELASKVKVEPVIETKNNLYRLFATNQESKVIIQTKNGLMEAEEAQIGDEVVVAEDGRSYAATIKSRRPDGTYELSFGQEKPRQERNYKHEELRKTAEAPAAANAGKPAPAVTPQRPA
jgi:hypothetical protein